MGVPVGPQQSTVQNLEGTERIKGAEISFHYPWTETFSFKGAYTYTKSSALSRSPTHQGSLTVMKDWNDWRFESTLFYSGVRQDWQQKHLSSYSVQNVLITYKATDQWRLYGSINNIWDERYEVLSNYRSPRRVFYVGTRFNF